MPSWLLAIQGLATVIISDRNFEDWPLGGAPLLLIVAKVVKVRPQADYAGQITAEVTRRRQVCHLASNLGAHHWCRATRSRFQTTVCPSGLWAGLGAQNSIWRAALVWRALSHARRVYLCVAAVF
jgi:hypothetical protein